MIPYKSGQLMLLTDRVGQCRVLREHHVWEAVKALWPDGWQDAFGQSRRAFATLLETNALVDAVRLLVAKATPRRCVEILPNANGRWTCRTRADFPRGPQVFGATHADLAAAILESFLLTIPERAPPDQQKESFCNDSFLTGHPN
jgi:hypothetical protein